MKTVLFVITVVAILGGCASSHNLKDGDEGFWAMMIFLAVLVVGFVYEWRKGALEWD